MPLLATNPGDATGQARLVLRWVTVSGFNSRCGTSISVCKQPPRPTQPGHPFVGRCNKYQPKGCDALRLGSKGRYVSCVGGCVIPFLHKRHIWVGMVHFVSGWTRGVQVKLWDPLRTRAIPERFRGAFTTRRYTNPRLPLPYIHVGHTKALYKLTIYFTFTL